MFFQYILWRNLVPPTSTDPRTVFISFEQILWWGQLRKGEEVEEEALNQPLGGVASCTEVFFPRLTVTNLTPMVHKVWLRLHVVVAFRPNAPLVFV